MYNRIVLLRGIGMPGLIGIDFGAINIKTGYLKRGKVHFVKDEYGSDNLENVVFISKRGDIYIGKSAVEKSMWDSRNVVEDLKDNLKFTGSYLLNGKRYSSADLVSVIFKKIKDIYERISGNRDVNSFISIPPINPLEASCLLYKAALDSGFKNVSLLEEYMAAYYYFLDKFPENGKVVLLLDFGGGGIRASVMVRREPLPEVIFAIYDRTVGGRQIDQKVTAYLVKKFYNNTLIDLMKEPFGYRKLLFESRKAKESLSYSNRVNIHIPFISANANGAVHFEEKLTRYELEELIAPLIKRTLLKLRAEMVKYGIRVKDIDEVFLTGGSSVIPFFVREIENMFTFSKLIVDNTGKTVSNGLMVFKNISTAGHVMTASRSYGIETYMGEYYPVIGKGEVLPVVKRVSVTTVRDFQRAVKVKIYSGDKKRARNNDFLEAVELRDIKRARRGEPTIDLYFFIDMNGRLKVLVHDLDTGRLKNVYFNSNKKEIDFGSFKGKPNLKVSSYAG